MKLSVAFATIELSTIPVKGSHPSRNNTKAASRGASCVVCRAKGLTPRLAGEYRAQYAAPQKSAAPIDLHTMSNLSDFHRPITLTMMPTIRGKRNKSDTNSGYTKRDVIWFLGLAFLVIGLLLFDRLLTSLLLAFTVILWVLACLLECD